MTVNFSVDESNLVAEWLEGVLWGVYSILFVIFILLWSKKPLRQAISPATVAAVIMYTLATLHMAFELMRLVQAFIIYRDNPGPTLYYAGSTWVSITADYFYIINMVLGDAILVWRLYIVWSGNIWVTVIGSIMVLGTAICGLTASTMAAIPTASFTEAINWGTSMFVISLSTNVIVTLLIAGKILFQAWSMRSITGSMGNYSRVILVVTESGTLITLAKITEFVLYMAAPDDSLAGNNAMYIPNKCMPQITGIAPLMILIAVATGFTNRTTYNGNPTTAMQNTLKFAHQSTTQQAVTEDDTTNQFMFSLNTTDAGLKEKTSETSHHSIYDA